MLSGAFCFAQAFRTSEGKRMIGIDANNGLLYEGLTFYGHGVWPKPLMLAATLVLDETSWTRVPASGNLRSVDCLFREDYFDPVSRIRRGRFYDRNQSSVAMWWVHPHPAGIDLGAPRNQRGQLNIELQTYVSKRLSAEFIQKVPAPTVVLGAQPSVTAWTVVAVERDGADEDVVTLKARLNFGYLPELVLQRIPRSRHASNSCPESTLRRHCCWVRGGSSFRCAGGSPRAMREPQRSCFDGCTTPCVRATLPTKVNWWCAPPHRCATSSIFAGYLPNSWRKCSCWHRLATSNSKRLTSKHSKSVANR